MLGLYEELYGSWKRGAVYVYTTYGVVELN